MERNYYNRRFIKENICKTRAKYLGLLHCRQILYCLSHQGSPIKKTLDYKAVTYFIHLMF